jgi:hypothetical protein
MPADNAIASIPATIAPQRSTKGRCGPVQTVSNNTSALTLGDLARARAAKAVGAPGIVWCEEMAHE